MTIIAAAPGSVDAKASGVRRGPAKRRCRAAPGPRRPARAVEFAEAARQQAQRRRGVGPGEDADREPSAEASPRPPQREPSAAGDPSAAHTSAGSQPGRGRSEPSTRAPLPPEKGVLTAPAVGRAVEVVVGVLGHQLKGE